MIDDHVALTGALQVPNRPARPSRSASVPGPTCGRRSWPSSLVGSFIALVILAEIGDVSRVPHRGYPRPMRPGWPVGWSLPGSAVPVHDQGLAAAERRRRGHAHCRGEALAGAGASRLVRVTRAEGDAWAGVAEGLIVQDRDWDAAWRPGGAAERLAGGG